MTSLRVRTLRPILLFGLFLVLLTGVALLNPDPAVAQSAGRGYLTSAADLDTIRQQANLGVEPYRSLVADFINSSGTPSSWSSGTAGTRLSVSNSLCISDTQPDRDRFVNQQGGAQEAYRKMLAYHLTRNLDYARVAREKVLELTRTGYYGGEEYSGANECILHLSRALPLWIQAADLLEGTSIWTAADRQQLVTWLARTAYPKVAWVSRVRRNNWGSVGSLAAAMLGDYVGSNTSLTEVLPVSRVLTGAQAFTDHNAQQMKRLNTQWQGDSKCTIWGIRASGGIPDELRRGATGCTGDYLVTADGAFEYTVAHIDDLVFHAEFLRRRGDRSMYDNRAADGTGSVLSAILFVIANPVDATRSYQWPTYKTGILTVANTYYRNAVIDRAIYTGSLERGATISFGQLTHPKVANQPATATPTGTRATATPTATPTGTRTTSTPTVTPTGTLTPATPTTTQTIVTTATPTGTRTLVTTAPTTTASPVASSTPPPDQVRNGDFSNGLTNWTFTSDVSRTVTNGVLNAYRTNTTSWGGITSNLTFNTRNGHTLEASLQLGNSSSTPKSVIVYLNSATGGFTGSLACPYTIPANTPLTTYRFIGPVGSGWTGTGVAVQIVFQTADNRPSLLVDNVKVYQYFTVTVPSLNCNLSGTSPTAPTPSPTATRLPATATPMPVVAAPQVPSETRNGNFSDGLNNWTFTSDVSRTVTNGVLNAYRMNPTSWGGITNNMTFNAAVGHTLEATFQMGNSSGTAKNVTVYLNSATGGFAGSLACPFTIPARTPLTAYRLIGPVGTGWTGTGVAFQVVFQNADNAPSLLLDNVNVYKYFTVTTPRLNCNAGGTLTTALASAASMDLAAETPAPTETLLPATATTTLAATATATLIPPTATATATLVPATATATLVPPTATLTATATLAPPTATLTATATLAPPTATATATFPPPTATWTVTAAPPTATLVPPTVAPTLPPASPTLATDQTVVEASFVLGNLSSERHQVVLLVGDPGLATVQSCAFWLEPNAPAQLFTLKASLGLPWNDVQSMLQTPDGNSGSWLDVRRVSMRQRPNQSTAGTECAGPLPYNGPTNGSTSNTTVLEAPALPAPLTADVAVAAVAAPPEGQAELQAAPLPLVVTETVPSAPTAAPAALPVPVSASMDDNAPDWAGTAGWRLDAAAAWGGAGLGWVVTSTQPRETLTWNRWLDLSTVAQARLEFQSRLLSAGSTASVELSLDGTTWISLAPVVSGADWQLVAMDLTPYVGWRVQIRFVWDSAQPADQWALDQVSVAEGAPALPTPAPVIEGPTVAPALDAVLPPDLAPTLVPTLDVVLPPGIVPTADPAAGVVPVPAPVVLSAVVPPEGLPPLTVPAVSPMDDGAPDWVGTAGWRLDAAAAWGGAGLGWVVTSTQPRETLTWNRWLDLSTVAQARLEFQSRLLSAGSMAGVEVSLDGMTWMPLVSVAPSADWQPLVADLGPYAGQRVLIRLVWDANLAPAAGAPADVWQIDQVTLTDAAVQVLPTLVPTAIPEAPVPVEPTATPAA